jgi:16S rRNA (cytidine1402-2'-O)-methyltransferase
MQKGKLILIPVPLDEDAIESIPLYVKNALENCQIFFAENEKTARRFFKKIWKEMVIDHYQWHNIHKAEEQAVATMLQSLKAGNTVGIVSEAGCPGIADPGQILVSAAQNAGFVVQPLVGPNSILLALMASGLNGQQFSFCGYLPIDALERRKKIMELELISAKTGSTQIFIETPYRNNALLEEICKSCNPQTRLCLGIQLTGKAEKISTKTIQQWRSAVLPNLHKQPVIFLLQA